jgi:hypothetical protein
MARLSALALLIALLIAGCGGDSGSSSGEGGGADTGKPFDAAIAQARDVSREDFEPTEGRTLQEIADPLPAVQAGLATSVYTPGENRLAFGVIDQANEFVYGKTALYLARGPDEPAIGPFPAPADPLVVDPPFRSEGAALATGDIAAIYETQVELPDPGQWSVLAVSKSQGKTYGAATQIEVTRDSPIPAVGEPAPRVETETLASADGDVASIDTRQPPSDLHENSFAEVVGEKPVALLFATPQLCQTRVCGPVVDIAAQLQAKYGEQVEFIHQEVYVDNMVEQGLRPPLERFELRTEPWLFTVDAQGRVAARLEGSFGNEAFERAIQAAL